MDIEKIYQETKKQNYTIITKKKEAQMKKRKSQLAKSPKRDHLGYDPAYTPSIKLIIEHHKKTDPKFSRNDLVKRWVEEELARLPKEQVN